MTLDTASLASIPYRLIYPPRLAERAVKAVKLLVALKCVEIVLKTMSEMHYLPSLFAQIPPRPSPNNFYNNPLFMLNIINNALQESRVYARIADRTMKRILFEHSKQENVRSPIPGALLPKVSEKVPITLDLERNCVRIFWQGKEFLYQVIERNVDDIHEANLIGGLEKHGSLFYYFFHALLIHSLYQSGDGVLVEHASQEVPSSHRQLEFIDLKQVKVGGWDKSSVGLIVAQFFDSLLPLVEAKDSKKAKELKALSEQQHLAGIKDLKDRNIQQGLEIEQNLTLTNKLFIIMGKGHGQYLSRPAMPVNEEEYQLYLRSVDETLKYYRTKKFIILNAIHPDNPHFHARREAAIHRGIKEKIEKG